MKKIMIFVLCFVVACLVVNGSITDFPNLRITYLNQDPDPAQPGQYVDVRFKIENIGSGAAENAAFQILEAYPLSVYSGDSTQELGTIYGRQRADNGVIVHYKLKIDENAVEGDNTFSIRYATKNTGWMEKENYTVRVQSHFAIVSVEDVETMPTELIQGKESKLTIKLKNMADSYLDFLKVKLDLVYVRLTGAATAEYVELPFSPVGSTNEKTVRKVAPGDTVDFEFHLITDPDATPGVYKLPVYVMYADELKKNYTSAHITSLYVGSKPELLVLADQSDQIKPGTTQTITLQFVNKDITDIKFLTVSLMSNSHYEVLSSHDYYVGNIDSDDYETADFKVYLSQTNDSIVKIPVNIEYQDPNGVVYKRTENIEFAIYTQREIQKFGLNKQSNIWGIVIVIAIVVAGFFIYRKWSKRKKKTA